MSSMSTSSSLAKSLMFILASRSLSSFSASAARFCSSSSAWALCFAKASA